MLTIRQGAVADLPAARKLLAQLGYDLEEAEVRRRYEAVSKATDHALLVTDQDGAVIGLLHLYVRPALDKPPEVVVQALVVDEAAPRNWCRPQSDGNRRAMGGRARFYFGCADIPHRPIRGTYVLSKAWLSDRCHVPPDAKEIGIVRP